MIPDALSGSFAVEQRGRYELIARSEQLDALREEGLNDPDRWAELLGGPARSSGRGATARVALADGTRLLLKKMRRGGLTAGLWRDRFPGRGRLVGNLTIPEETARRGVATARAVALLLERGPFHLYRGWLAVEEIAGACDLVSWIREGRPVAAVQGAMALVRTMHDRGIDHRDLNLGNLLVQTGDGGETRVFVIDLDDAAIFAGAIPFRLRVRALHRLARSYAKSFGPAGPLGTDAVERLTRLYAGDDAALESRLLETRAMARLSIAVHRLSWREKR